MSQVREIISTWRSQSRQPGSPSDASSEDGQRGGNFDILDRMFSRREGRPEALSNAGNDALELWLGFGSRHDDPAPSFLERLQSFFGRRGGSGILGDRLGFGFGSHRSPSSRRLVDMRNFLLGPGGDLLIQQLMEGGEAGRSGSTPAWKAAVEAMPTLIISKHNLNDEDVYCAICKDIFNTGDEAREMPCKHIYHNNCILPWLALHNSCPICRHQMPSEAHANDPSGHGETPGGNQVETNSTSNGDRALAIVGIPGIGILVRSFSLYGGRAASEAIAENESPHTDIVTQTVNNTSASEDGPRLSEFSHHDESFTSASCNDDMEASSSRTPRLLQHSQSVDFERRDMVDMHAASNLDSVTSGNRTARTRRTRSLLSWLSRPATSLQMRLANMSNTEASGSLLRRRRFWF
ncbi:hypothetical protein KP509_15G074200 [Ceratopteris richardii]|nr:hypothetical protein KP509_15G074200 [Ceratopteris richardii]